MKYLRTLFVLGVILNIPVMLQAQPEEMKDHPVYLWLDAGIGEGSFGTDSSLELSLLTHFGLFSARYKKLETEGFTTPHYFHEGYYLKRMTEWAVMFGQAYQRPFWFASASVGLSVLRTEYDHPGIGSSTIGLPFQAEIFTTPFAFLGFGFTFNSNVNDVKSFTSTSVCVRVGVLRYYEPRGSE